ncbi:MAG: glycosyltransferase family 2 protein, partial [Fervidicoccus fontis]
MSKLLSIVLPVRNETYNLLEVCKSISAQRSREVFEVIIVDDSDPEYEVFVKKCVEDLRSSNVDVEWVKGSRRGVGIAMLSGLERARGDYVFFIDTDNVLERDFMETVTPLLNKGYFVSLLSKSVISRCCRSLFYAQQLLSTLRGGLNFNRAYGFVNTLYIWQRNILLREARVRRPEISLLDDLGPANLVALHRKLLRHYHIDKVLVKDVRHVYEKFDAMFIYKRLKWYYNDYGSLATKKDYLIALLIAPLTIIAMAFLMTYLGLLTLFLLITYAVLMILT